MAAPNHIPVLEFWPDGHAYVADGQKMPRSVTKVIRDVGLSGVYEFRNPIHGYRGTACHDAAAMIISGLHEYPTMEPLSASILRRPDAAHYIQVHADMEGYFEAIRRAKAAIRFVGTIYECGFISVRDGLGGKLDFCAWSHGSDMDQFWDLKSGTMPSMLPVQLCGYEYLSKFGLSIDPQHAGLDWLMDVVNGGRPFERCGLLIEKTGRFTAFYETKKGDPFSLPKWMTLWKSALLIHKMVPDHEYLTDDGNGGYHKVSRLSDTKWLAEQIKERLTGPVYDACMRAGENIFIVRQQYGLL